MVAYYIIAIISFMLDKNTWTCTFEVDNCVLIFLISSARKSKLRKILPDYFNREILNTTLYYSLLMYKIVEK